MYNTSASEWTVTPIEIDDLYGIPPPASSSAPAGSYLAVKNNSGTSSVTHPEEYEWIAPSIAAGSDYEKGSWTPTADFTTTSPTSGATTGTGRYTKIGNLVTVWGTVLNFNVTGAAGDLKITGLPFTARLLTGLQRYNGPVRITNCDFSGFNNPIQLNSQVLDNATVVTVVVTRDNAASDSVSANELNDGVSDVNFTLTYETSA